MTNVIVFHVDENEIVYIANALIILRDPLIPSYALYKIILSEYLIAYLFEVMKFVITN